MPRTGRWPAGTSGNPQGRPPGRPDRRQRLRNLIDTHSEELVGIAVQAARAGDMQALGLLLQRALPPARPEGQPVRFPRPTGSSPAEWARAILAAVADGVLPPDVGKNLIDAIGMVSTIEVNTELEQRVRALEEGS